jgi:hypothetical protein
MQTIKKKEFYSIIDRGSGRTFCDTTFEECLFDFCAISETNDIAKRNTVKNIRLFDCITQNHCSIGPAIIEDVIVDGLITDDLFILWDPLFKHVTLRGEVGQIKINDVISHEVDSFKPEIQKPFDKAKKKYYQKVDWALDISEAEFILFELSGVPLHLVRRDTESQVIIKRENAENEDLRKKIKSTNSWIVDIEVSLMDNETEFLFVAPKGRSKKNYQKSLDDLKELRDIGLAEPD